MASVSRGTPDARGLRVALSEARGVSRHEWSSEHSTIFANAAIADIDMGAFRERVCESQGELTGAQPEAQPC